MYAIRSYYGKRGGGIAALRAAVAAQAILTFDDALQTARDLSDVPVTVQESTGSHYTTLQMLESAVVITSYSIHYTKLYEPMITVVSGDTIWVNVHNSSSLCPGDPNRGGEATGGPGAFETWSYNFV